MTAKDVDKKNRARIKYWLELYDMSRKELADKLGVTESALNGWLATRALPPARWEEIKSIFEQYEEPERKRIIGTSVSDEEYANMQKVAEKQGLNMETYFRACILAQMDKDLRDE